MFYKKLSLLALVAMSFSHASEATMRGSSNFDGSTEDFTSSMVINVAPKAKVKEFDYQKFLPNLKFVNTSSKGKEKEENAKANRPNLRDLLSVFRNEHPIVQADNSKALSYTKKHNVPIAINKELMDSRFILSMSGNTALRLSNSNVYHIIQNPGDIKKKTSAALVISAGLNLFEVKEKAFQAAEKKQPLLSDSVRVKRQQMFGQLGGKFYKKPAAEANKQAMFGQLGKKFYNAMPIKF